jgi:BolA protein
MNRQQRLEQLLNEAFKPSILQVVDESGKHAGHAGARPQGETHYNIIMKSQILNGLSRVQQHQRVYASLQSEMTGAEAIHALAMEVSGDD